MVEQDRGSKQTSKHIITAESVLIWEVNKGWDEFFFFSKNNYGKTTGIGFKIGKYEKDGISKDFQSL